MQHTLVIPNSLIYKLLSLHFRCIDDDLYQKRQEALVKWEEIEFKNDVTNIGVDLDMDSRITEMNEERQNLINQNKQKKWMPDSEIGLTTDIVLNAKESVRNMILKIISLLNDRYGKLNIINCRSESERDIKDKVENSGDTSQYQGYLETTEGNIDGLFFYNEPTQNNANDITTRNVWAVLIGIYGSISERMRGLKFNNRPIYIVNLNETGRMGNPSVKESIICAILMGFHYIDIFDNELTDIIPIEYNMTDRNQQGGIDPCKVITTLERFDAFLSRGDGQNDYFEIDEENHVFRISNKLARSQHIPQDIYRYCARTLPATYMAKNGKYKINIENWEQVAGRNAKILTTYLRKFTEL